MSPQILQVKIQCFHMLDSPKNKGEINGKSAVLSCYRLATAREPYVKRVARIPLPSRVLPRSDEKHRHQCHLDCAIHLERDARRRLPGVGWRPVRASRSPRLADAWE